MPRQVDRDVIPALLEGQTIERAELGADGNYLVVRLPGLTLYADYPALYSDHEITAPRSPAA